MVRQQVRTPKKWPKVVMLLLATLAIAAGGVAAYVKLAPRRTPEGQPPLLKLVDGNLAPFVEAFNANPDSTRVLVMLSPT